MTLPEIPECTVTEHESGGYLVVHKRTDQSELARNAAYAVIAGMRLRILAAQRAAAQREEER